MRWEVKREVKRWGEEVVCCLLFSCPVVSALGYPHIVGDLPDPGIQLTSPVQKAYPLPPAPPAKPFGFLRVF